MHNRKAKPFLKWAGGKSQLLAQINKYAPQELREGKIKTYIEPFAGAGAVFFALNELYSFDKIILNDYNEDLILTYKTIRDEVDELIGYLAQLEKTFLGKGKNDRKMMYYNIRKEFNEDKKFEDKNVIKHAANFIFLNKTCYNGLYRLNSKGEFNVPIGAYKKPTICDEQNLRKVSAELRKVILVHGDFEELTQYVDNCTFVYMDPPYRPLSGTACFNNYQKASFNDAGQKRLARWFYKLNAEHKALLMLSNSDPKNSDPNDDFFDELYKGFNIIRVSAARAINAKGYGRGAVNELLITNYRPNPPAVALEEPRPV
ncbi:Modification methylase DpnIIA [Sporotomaculum syntrophicum]|uniref:Site-specific DNA-methyltransferase (adenine-specific) n=1 Tax=Sporotomaculum syntrophicum TaxID=182264 RepID=A0A9D3AZZ8_9FIRM|nr:DNA adenine methylase [Sporotomaculum syntrophicum]KAF1086398.1 Modification methylase DpnIIA [Sporotomaculum syntrophicum]